MALMQCRNKFIKLFYKRKKPQRIGSEKGGGMSRSENVKKVRDQIRGDRTNLRTVCYLRRGA